MAYDQRCYDLAEVFLDDSPHLNTERRRDELAQLIQSTIESFISYEESNYEPPRPARVRGRVRGKPLTEGEKTNVPRDEAGRRGEGWSFYPFGADRMAGTAAS